MATEYDMFADVYDQQYGTTTFDLDFYVEEARAAQPPVLELACGTGRVTLSIAQAGVPIVGVDSSTQMLARGREKAAALGDLPVRWVQADMRDFHLEERFGLAFIPARSFLHLLNPEDQIQALTNIGEHLAPGGRLALNLFVPDLEMIARYTSTTEQMLKFLHEFTDAKSGARVAVWESRRYDVHLQRIYQQYRYEQLDEDGFVVATRYRNFTLCYIGPREMEHLLARCGYEIEAVYGWFDRRPLDAHSGEQIWVARH
jgi:ubiquinone/menaquinone biosynthesis C-methylase UbiE